MKAMVDNGWETTKGWVIIVADVELIQYVQLLRLKIHIQTTIVAYRAGLQHLDNPAPQCPASSA